MYSMFVFGFLSVNGLKNKMKIQFLLYECTCMQFYVKTQAFQIDLFKKMWFERFQFDKRTKLSASTKSH